MPTPADILSPSVSRPFAGDPLPPPAGSAYGMDFRSEIDLPTLDPCCGAPEVTIRRGVVDCVPEHLKRAGGNHSRVSPDRACLIWDKVGVFDIRDGNRVLVEPAEDCDAGQLRLGLLGLVSALLLHQRGGLTLHASVVFRNGEAVAFLGASGHGKSTIAAILCGRGWTLLSDDLLALHWHDDAVWALPGPPLLRLHSEALALPAMPPAAATLQTREGEKFLWHARTSGTAQPIRLSRIYLIDPGPADAIESLPESTGLQTAARQMAFAEILAPSLDPRHCFIACGRLARLVPIYRWMLPRDPATLDRSIRMLEVHLASHC